MNGLHLLLALIAAGFAAAWATEYRLRRQQVAGYRRRLTATRQQLDKANNHADEAQALANLLTQRSAVTDYARVVR